MTNAQYAVIFNTIDQAITENYIGSYYDKVYNYCETIVMNAIENKGIENIKYLSKYVYTIVEDRVDYFFRYFEV